MAADLSYDEISYRQYTNEVLNSQGFYVLSKYGSKVICGITKLEKDTDFALFNKAEEAGRFAVEKYNMENCDAKLKFMKILNVNIEAAAGKIFYITLAAKDSDNVKHFQAKVWAKINIGFQLQFFSLAPFTPCNLENSEESYIIRIDNLEAWMDENYLYYMCFYKSAKQLMKVKVARNGQTGETEEYGLLEFTSNDAAVQALIDYDGTRMPYTTRCYKLEWPSNNSAAT